MTQEQFSKLPFTQQCLITKKLAVEVARRYDDLYGYILFQFDSFYIELRFDRYFDIIQQVMSFEQNRMPGNYLDNINIQGILS